MKKMLMMLALLILLPFCAAAEEAPKTFYDYLPEAAQQACAEQYPDHTVNNGAIIYDDARAVLLLLGHGRQNTAVMMEKTGDAYTTVAVNDALIPDGEYDDERWWIQDKWSTGEPYIWYSPKNNTDTEFYYELDRGEDGLWMISGGHFQTAEEGLYGFNLANEGTALRVYKDNYYGGTYMPLEIDLALAAFEPQIVEDALRLIVAERDNPSLIPSTMEADAIPQGQVIVLAGEGDYPVYAGPGTEYARLGYQRGATVSNDGWIIVYGREGDWLFIQYRAEETTRFGYITADALPADVAVPELAFTRKPGVVSVYITDDPLRSAAETFLHENAEGVQLATMGDEWVYVEIDTAEHGKMRGFAGGINLREDHEGYAVVQAERAMLYADASAASPIGFYSGGVELEVLKEEGAFAHVRLTGRNAHQEGYIQTSDLALCAVHTDVPYTPGLAVVLVAEGENRTICQAFTQSNAEAQRMSYDRNNAHTLLGEANGYSHLGSRYYPYNRETFFVPTDWVIPATEDFGSYGESVSVVLTRDATAHIRPDAASPSPVTLYKDMRVTCYPAGGWYLISDHNLRINGSGETSTLGYLPADACRPADESAAQMPVGMLAPVSQGDSRTLYTALNESGADGTYGWGTRVILLGESAGSYLVRTPLGAYGFFTKEDITHMDGVTAAQESYAELGYGYTTLSVDTLYYAKPYIHGGQYGEKPSGTEVFLLGNLGNWWSVAVNGQTCFLPEEVLSDVPPDAPAYDGIYRAFRDTRFCFPNGTAPALAIKDDEIWLLVKEEDDSTTLSHRMRQGDAWVEQERIDNVLGQGARSISHFSMDTQSDPMRLSIGCFVEESRAQLTQTFAYIEGTWQFTGLHVREVSTGDGSVGSLETVLRDELYHPPASDPALDLAAYSALEMLHRYTPAQGAD